jgi:hypothetical protein
MFENLSSNEKLLAAFIMLMAIVGVSNSNFSLLFFILLLVIAYGAYRFLPNKDADGVDYHTANDDYEDSVRPYRLPNYDHIYVHALDAVRNALHNPDDILVLPVDIGLLSFYMDEDPVIHRTHPIANDSDYIQPYIQLRVPTPAAGKVKFEIYDHSSQLVFVNENQYQLKRGRNLIVPSTRLPVHDEQEMNGDWSMKVYADGTLLAIYPFGWNDPDEQDFRRHIGEDGEINSELRAVLAENRLGRMSLDDLLAHQEDVDNAAQRTR